MDELLEYKEKLFNDISIVSENEEVFPEESFFEYVSEVLSDAGILDNVEYCPYRNTRKGLRLDGYSWNALERTICGIIVDFTNEPDTSATLTNTVLTDIGKRVTRFFESATTKDFIESLEVTDPGRMAASDIDSFLKEALKIRVVVFTDQVLSSRIKKLSIESILEKDTSIEVWDIERLKGLEEADGEYEPFTVDLEAIGGGIRALPANISEHGFSTYLAVMPAKTLSAIYDEYGQRLLESNVRTFLDFRAATNRGMRASLVTEPDHFFAYNNGLTVTATSIETTDDSGVYTITALENMQIVNGGQTTAAIYFSPREKGGIRGEDGTHLYSDIQLEKVYIQMKLTVIEQRELADEMKTNIATFANSQNSIQQSDLISNHPFHVNIETRSRKQLMPPGEDGLSTKWFYERARGQYSTLLRARNAKLKTKFQTEYPKKQLFSKTDMAKYENTWRMKPWQVKKGAQANLKLLGEVITKEFEKDEKQFEAAYFNDLVSKMILFRSVDTAVLQAEWYKDERGLKAEIVTYAIALLRYALTEQDKDIDLASIFKHQRVSNLLLDRIVALARTIRTKITDFEFTGGVTNPSEFCKSEKGWNKIQTLDVDLDALGVGEILSSQEVSSADDERDGVNTASQTIGAYEYVMDVSANEWDSLAEFYSKLYPSSHKNVGIPQKCANMHRHPNMVMLSERQFEQAKQIRIAAQKDGFDFIS